MVFPDPAAGDIPRHPSQIYEALLEGVLLFAFLWTFSKKPRPMGLVSGAFLVGYGAARFLVEFVRRNDEVWAGLTVPQIESLALIAIGLGWFALASRRRAVLA